MSQAIKNRLIVGIITASIAIYLAVDLFSLYSNDTLWGQRVLWFWVMAWATVLTGLGHKMTSSPDNNKILLASTVSGVLLAGGFMPMPTFFLMFIGFVPLLWAEHTLSKESNETSKWTVFKLAFNSFLIWNILSTWWIQNSSFVAGMLGNMLNAVFMSIPFVFYHITKKTMSQRAANMGFISYWLTFEIGHLTWDLSWPWLTLGNSFAQMPSIVQWYEFTGVFGGSLWILGLNIWIANYIFNRLNKEEHNLGKSTAIKIVLGFVLPIIVSLGMYYTHDVKSDELVEVVSVQPNFEPHYQKFSVPEQQQFARFMQLSDTAVTDKTAYLVFPETSFRGIQADKIEEAGVIGSLREFNSKYTNLNIVLGLSTYLRYQEGDKMPSHLYTYCNEDKSFCQYIDAHNSAIQLNNETKEIPYYKKSKLVPGAESMPFIGGVEFFKGLILDLGGAPGVSLGTQEKRETFASKHGKVAPLICYESIYGDYVTDYVKEGAEAFFVITNDGWWDNSLGHRQHMFLSSLRAIECRRYVVRSANTGVSCFINSRGDIYHPTNYNEAIAVRDEIYMRTDQTFYVLYGDLIGRVSILLSAWLLLSGFSNKLREQKEEL